MEDPKMLVSVLKLVMLLVMGGGAVAVFRELVPMARGRVKQRVEPTQREEA